MNGTNRITVADAEDAYARTRLTVLRGYLYSDDGASACPLGAVAASLGVRPDNGLMSMLCAIKALHAEGYSREYRHGFADGYAGGPERGEHVEYMLGHDDGTLAWLALSHRARQPRRSWLARLWAAAWRIAGGQGLTWPI